jgi:uncharacterized membrane protein
MSEAAAKIADKLNLDKIGISASLLCAIHCALVPLILPVMSTLGLGFLWSHETEVFMIVFAFVVGVWSLGHGYIHAHHNLRPFILFSIGMSIILISKLIFHHEHEYIILPIGAIFIIAAHWQNWKMHTHCDAVS